MNLERMELILSTVDKLGVVSVRQLHQILRLGSYRNTCRIVGQLEEYLNVDRGREKIVYLNKEGRNLIGSDREVKKSALLEHMLLVNDIYIHYGCPATWEREHTISLQKSPVYDFQIKVKGLSLKTEKIIADAKFERNGYTYLIEIDNTRTMIDNKKKIKKYIENWVEIRKQYSGPKLCIFTHSKNRKRTFRELLRNVPNEIYTFEQIK